MVGWLILVVRPFGMRVGDLTPGCAGLGSVLKQART